MRAMEYTPVQCRCEPRDHWDMFHRCLIHGTQIEPTKKLTDAECAAEYWRAMYDVMTMIAQDFGYQATPQPHTMREVIRWGEVANRFATYPHASEVCPHCGGGPWRHVRDLPNGSVIVQCRECKAATDLKEWEA